MAGLVAQYAQGAFSTPINGTIADASVVLSNDNATRVKHNSHDADPTIHIQSSSLASRPAAGTAQRVWVTTDGLRAYVDSGAVWAEIAYLPMASGGTITGNVTITGALVAGTVASGGVVTAGTSFVAGASNQYAWVGQGGIHAIGDGVFTMRNSADTDYGALGVGSVLLGNAIINSATINYSGFVGQLKIFGGTTGLAIRNAADTFSNVAITDLGSITLRASVFLSLGQVITWNSSNIGFSDSGGHDVFALNCEGAPMILANSIGAYNAVNLVNGLVLVDTTSTARETALSVYDVDNATLERVTVGVADSGGVGFKLLRIPN